MKRNSSWLRWSVRGVVSLLILGAGLASGSRAQEGQEEKKRELIVGKWYPSVETGVTLTQSAYTSNWAGGDKGSVVWTAILNGVLESQLHQKMNWLNTLKLAYGQTHQQKEDAATGDRFWDRPEKSSDLIDFESLSRFTLGGFVDPFAAIRFESQFQDVSGGTSRSLALNPLKFKESAGIARKFIDEKDRSLISRLGFTFRQSSRRTFDEPAPSKATSAETSNDGGFEWVTDSKRSILADRVAWTVKVGVYKPVFYSGKQDLEDLPADVLLAAGLDPDVASYSTSTDLEWENILSSQITKVLSVNLYTRWVYDKYDNTVKPLVKTVDESPTLENPDDVHAAVRKAGQFKQTLAIGITYRFL
jgi:hypothetical protein